MTRSSTPSKRPQTRTTARAPAGRPRARRRADLETSPDGGSGPSRPKPPSRRGLADGLRLAGPREEEGLEPPDPLDLGRPPRAELERLAEPLAHLAGDVDAIRLAAVLEPRREVHRIAPDVVAEFLGPDHAGHHRPHGDADAQRQLDVEARAGLAGGRAHLERHAGKPRGVVRRGLREARHRHIGVADGLDLLDAMLGGELVEAADEV